MAVAADAQRMGLEVAPAASLEVIASESGDCHSSPIGVDGDGIQQVVVGYKSWGFTVAAIASSIRMNSGGVALRIAVLFLPPIMAIMPMRLAFS